MQNPNKISKSNKTNKSKKKLNNIDEDFFVNLKADDLLELDHNNPDFIRKMGLDPYPDCTGLNFDEKRKKLRSYHNKIVVQRALIECLREKVYMELSNMRPTTSDDCEDSEDSNKSDNPIDSEDSDDSDLSEDD